MEAHNVLGVAMDASEEQIRRAYKALVSPAFSHFQRTLTDVSRAQAMKWHPDRRLQEKDEATEKFVEVRKH